MTGVTQDIANKTKEWDFEVHDSRPVSDPIVQRVIDKFKERHLAGMKKYGVTLQDNPLPALAWITHAQEEAMDFVLYLERLKVLRDIKEQT